MDKHDKKRGFALSDKNLDLVTGGWDNGQNSFQCPFCSHPPFNSNSELINHVTTQHQEKTTAPEITIQSNKIRYT